MRTARLLTDPGGGVLHGTTPPSWTYPFMALHWGWHLLLRTEPPPQGRHPLLVQQNDWQNVQKSSKLQTLHRRDYYCSSIVVFTTNWKFWCCCIHCLFGVNECQWLVCTHTFPFIPNWCYLIISNTRITFPLTQCSIHDYKMGNNVSEFMHLNCITLSY